MRFAAPGSLWLLLLIPALAVLIAVSFRRRRRALEAFGEPHLMRQLTGSASTERRLIKATLLLGAVFFLVLALARPQWGTRLETVSRRGVDVIVAVDTSLSMLTEDVKPSRLAQARAAVSSLIDMLHGDRIGLVAFAGAAYVACPLTLDYTAAGLFVDVLDTQLIPVQGTAIAEAINTSVRAFKSNERRYKVLILITDGEDHEGDVEAAARNAADQGVTIYTVGVGSPTGEPIPLRNERGEIVGYKEDRQHRKVTSRLGESALEAIAVATGGKYYRASPEGIELKRIYDDIGGLGQSTLSSRLHTAFEDRYQMPLALAILLLLAEAAVADRRRTEAGPAPHAGESS
ncbi:MAG TPA: VWA domain-containing protein [Candidatus Polarisedimenticolia bacterium]|nr:VWA domain-containing protein [Candidatus Polarisedimenticolia bacterium]